MIDTQHLCETCRQSPCAFGYNDCQLCLAKQARYAGPKPVYVWCNLCQTEVRDCLHRKMARENARRSS
jgi:hypothetical protein